jgi:hypothetical protein
MVRGNGEIEAEVRDVTDPNISRIQYKLYRRRRDGTIDQPPHLQAGEPSVKTVIRGLDPQKWRRLASEATERAIRMRALPRTGGEFQSLADDGTKLTLYYRRSRIETVFPAMR